MNVNGGGRKVVVGPFRILTAFQLALFNGASTSHFFFGLRPKGRDCGAHAVASKPNPGMNGGGAGPRPGIGGGGTGPPSMPGIGGGGGPMVPGIGGGRGPPRPGSGGGGGGPGPAFGSGGGGGGGGAPVAACEACPIPGRPAGTFCTEVLRESSQL